MFNPASQISTAAARSKEDWGGDFFFSEARPRSGVLHPRSNPPLWTGALPELNSCSDSFLDSSCLPRGPPALLRISVKTSKTVARLRMFPATP